MLADLRAQRFGWHQEGASKSVSGLLVIDFRCNIQNHVSEFVGDRESPALSPVPSIDDDHRRDAPVFAAHAGRETIDVGKRHGKDLDAAFFQELNKIWDRIESETPVAAEAERRLFRLRHIVENGPGGVARDVPGDGRQAENFLHREIALQQIEYPGLDLGFFAFARQSLSSEVDGFQGDVAVAGQIVDGYAESVRERNEDAGARHRLIALVLADRLRRDAVVNSGFKITKRQTFRTA